MTATKLPTRDELREKTAAELLILFHLVLHHRDVSFLSSSRWPPLAEWAEADPIERHKFFEALCDEVDARFAARAT